MELFLINHILNQVSLQHVSFFQHEAVFEYYSVLSLVKFQKIASMATMNKLQKQACTGKNTKNRLLNFRILNHFKRHNETSS